jgi:hypothetical protein
MLARMEARGRIQAIAAIVIATMALAAAFAQAASAYTWKEGTTFLANGESRNLAGSGGPFVFKTVVSGVNVEIKATGIEFLSAKIIQEGTVAAFSGSMKLTGATVIQPSGCTVSGGAITTSSLKGELIHVPSLASEFALKLYPASGSSLATITLVSGLCPPTFKISTTLFCAETSALGTMVVNQPLRFSKAIFTKCGGGLAVGPSEAELTGEATAKMTSAVLWGAE